MNLLLYSVTTSTPESWLPTLAYSPRSNVRWRRGPVEPKYVWAGTWSMLTSMPTAASWSLTSGMVFLRIPAVVLWYFRLRRWPALLTRMPSEPTVQPAASSIDRADIGHVECLGADRLNVACLQLREQRLLGGLEAADDDVVDGWLAAEVVGTRMEDHLHARIPAIEGVRAGTHRRSAEDAGLQVLDLGRVLRVEVDQRRHALGRIDHHVWQAVQVEGVDDRTLLAGLSRGMSLVLAHHLEDDAVLVLGNHVRVLGLEIVARRGAPDRVERQPPAEDDVLRGQRRAVAELGVLPQMERRFKVLVRAVADHDCIAVVQGGDVDR